MLMEQRGRGESIRDFPVQFAAKKMPNVFMRKDVCEESEEARE